jgi:hypothetical protein
VKCKWETDNEGNEKLQVCITEGNIHDVKLVVIGEQLDNSFQYLD